MGEEGRREGEERGASIGARKGGGDNFWGESGERGPLRGTRGDGGVTRGDGSREARRRKESVMKSPPTRARTSLTVQAVS